MRRIQESRDTSRGLACIMVAQSKEFRERPELDRHIYKTFDKSYNMCMSASLIQFIASQSLMKLIRGLCIEPQHVRGLASRYSLSASGVSDILRRLDQCGVLHEERRGNRRYVSLKLTSEDAECLQHLFRSYERSMVAQRSKRLSKRAEEKLKWMDESLRFYRGLKRGKVGAS